MSIAEMLKSGYAQPVPKGAFIFHENDLGAEMYIVLKGTVEIYMESNGHKIKLADITPGGFFGEMSLLEGQSRTATARTTSDSVLLIVTKTNFDEVISKAPQVALRIMKGLSSRIRDLNIRLKQKVSDDYSMSQTNGPNNAPGIPGQNNAAAVTTQTMSVESGPVVIKEEHFDQLLHREITCPVCGHSFKAHVVKESKLKQLKRTEELRVLYEDIDPLYYNVLICPECLYARKHDEFSKLDDLWKKKLLATINERKNKYPLDFTNRNTLGFILQTYLIAVECCECLGKRSLDEKIAGLWLNLGWLYEEMEKSAEAIQAKLQALDKYKNAYLMGAGGGEQDHKMEYLIGKLSWERGQTKEAREYLFKAATRRDGHSLLKQMAQDLLEEIKQAE